MHQLKKIALAAVLTASATAAAANPVRCTPGYQDSSCATVLLNAPQVAPVCSAAPGWVTVTPAKWAGSKWTTPDCSYTPAASCPADPGWVTSSPAVWNGSSWSAPACSYSAAPVCPDGFDQTAAPSWNGSSWVGLACQPKPAPLPRPEQQFNGLTFTIDTPTRGGWTHTFTVTGQADGFTVTRFSQYNASCRITGPGSRCGWYFSGKLGSFAQTAAEKAYSSGSWDQVCENTSGLHAQEMVMAQDGSLNIYSYYVPSALSCRQTGSGYYNEAYSGTIPASTFPQITNRSRVTYGINWHASY